MAILFYLVVTPVGLMRRMLGRDPLELSFDGHRASYWTPREPPGPEPDDLTKQY